jgi:hypothetical protein
MTAAQRAGADTLDVEKTVWAFARGDERLEVRREPDGGGVLLVMVATGQAPRCYRFPSLLSLIPFQCDMETMLLKTGWSLESFWPDRRTGRDRRGIPRIENDRRRWWTDGTTPPDRRSADALRPPTR